MRVGLGTTKVELLDGVVILERVGEVRGARVGDGVPAVGRGRARPRQRDVVPR